MELLYHGRRGRESGSVVCGMKRRHYQTMLLMLVMVVSMVLVLVWELAFPSATSGHVVLTPIHGNLAGTDVDDEKSSGYDRSINTHDNLKSDSSEPGSSAAQTRSDVTPNLVDGQSFKVLTEVEKQQDGETFIDEETDNSPDSDEKDERFNVGDVLNLVTVPENIEVPSSVDAMLFSERENEIERENEEKRARDGDDSETKLCDYTVGKWELDKTRPLYSGRECSMWLSPDFACRRHSHPDMKMDRYRWRPAACDLPAFNASAALETLRNKVIAFVGDSLGRQQYQSLLCMLTRGKNTTTITDVGSKYFNFHTPRGARKPTGYAYRFDATNTTVVFRWTVTLAGVQPVNNTLNALHLDRPEQFLQAHLHQLNVLVVNSGHHWNNGKMKQNRYRFYIHGKPVPASSPLSRVPAAYKHTVHSVVKWLHNHHKSEQVIYYRSLSPRHFRNGDWSTGGTCDRIRFEEGKPVQEGVRVDVNAESAIVGTGVRLLNVTSLSLERGETHVSKYGGGKGGQDCLHWCLPGVPDTWNEILLAELGGKFNVARSKS